MSETYKNYLTNPDVLQARSKHRQELFHASKLHEHDPYRVALEQYEQAQAETLLTDMFATRYIRSTPLSRGEENAVMIAGYKYEDMLRAALHDELPEFEYTRRSYELAGWQNKGQLSPTPDVDQELLEHSDYRPDIGLWKIRLLHNEVLHEVSLEGSDVELIREMLHLAGHHGPFPDAASMMSIDVFSNESVTEPVEFLDEVVSCYDQLLLQRTGVEHLYGRQLESGQEYEKQREELYQTMQVVREHGELLANQLNSYRKQLGKREASGELSPQQAERLEKMKLKTLVAELRRADAVQARRILGEVSMRYFEQADQLPAGSLRALELQTSALQSMKELVYCGGRIEQAQVSVGGIPTGNPEDMWGGVIYPGKPCIKPGCSSPDSGRDGYCDRCGASMCAA